MKKILTIISEAQHEKLVCAHIDSSHAFDTTGAVALGVDLEALLITQPDAPEEAVEICDTLVQTEAIDLIVIDTCAIPLSRLRTLLEATRRTTTVLLFLNAA